MFPAETFQRGRSEWWVSGRHDKSADVRQGDGRNSVQPYRRVPGLEIRSRVNRRCNQQNCGEQTVAVRAAREGGGCCPPFGQ